MSSALVCDCVEVFSKVVILHKVWQLKWWDNVLQSLMENLAGKSVDPTMPFMSELPQRVLLIVFQFLKLFMVIES